MPNSREDKGTWVRLAGLGVELAASIVGFTLLGVWIDRHFETSPWGVVICTALGFVGGFYNLVRSSLRAVRRSDTDSHNSNKG